MKGAIELLRSGTRLFAAIRALYPEGSTCTCTNGSTVLTAGDADGAWIFEVPEPGEWIVQATDGTNTKSEVVEITDEQRLASVSLSYSLVIFGSGGVSWTVRKAKPTAEIGETLYVYVNQNDTVSAVSTTELVDVTDYKTLYFEITEKIEPKPCGFIGLSNSTIPISGLGAVTDGVAYLDDSGIVVGTNAIDISSVSGSYYVCLATEGTSGNPRGVRCSKVWAV